MDFYQVVYNPSTAGYSISYGYDSGSVPAICQLGKRWKFISLFFPYLLYLTWPGLELTNGLMDIFEQSATELSQSTR